MFEFVISSAFHCELGKFVAAGVRVAILEERFAGPLHYGHQVALIREEGEHCVRVSLHALLCGRHLGGGVAGLARATGLRLATRGCLNLILDSAEDDYLLVRLVVRNHTHSVVVDVVELVRVVAKLELDPHFLIEQEQVNIVQQRRHVFFAQAVVAATCHHDR